MWNVSPATDRECLSACDTQAGKEHQWHKENLQKKKFLQGKYSHEPEAHKRIWKGLFFRHLTVFSRLYLIEGGKKEMATREMCPFIKTPPSNDCYCINTDSLKIPAFLEYCTNNFQRCNFYITHLKKTHVSQARWFLGKRMFFSLLEMKKQREIGKTTAIAKSIYFPKIVILCNTLAFWKK